MSTLEQINDVFCHAIDEFNDCEGMRRFWDRQLGLEHYASLMRQIFHHARENPQIQAAATAFFRGKQRTMVQPFLRHAMSEVGHDQLALNDTAALGYDVSLIPMEQPLPATTALVAFPYYQIYNQNPVGYLGYLYYLEFMPTTFGAKYMEVLGDMGVPREALSFLIDHTVIDVGHNKLMRDYVQSLVVTEDDVSSVCYAIQATGYLYGCMITEAFANADTPNLYGTNCQEASYA